jgi:hypothetical protein
MSFSELGNSPPPESFEFWSFSGKAGIGHSRKEITDVAIKDVVTIAVTKKILTA